MTDIEAGGTLRWQEKTRHSLRRKSLFAPSSGARLVRSDALLLQGIFRQLQQPDRPGARPTKVPPDPFTVESS